jgi:DNA-directed RNA polymerase subunit beta'
MNIDIDKISLEFENLNTSFDFIKLAIASPERIKYWAERLLPDNSKLGEITSVTSFNFRTQKPKPFGIFCEKIFGPIKNWQCECGQYEGSLINTVCKKCLVEFTETRVRRYRMGFIELHYPCVHIWYFKNNPNYLHFFIKLIYPGITLLQLEKIIYLNYNTKKKQHINIKVKNEFKEVYKLSSKLSHGNEIIKKVLDFINLPLELLKIRNKFENKSFIDLNKQTIGNKMELNFIRILESFILAKIEPSWMLLTALPVLPPSLRPFMESTSDQILSSDLNELYNHIIQFNRFLIEYTKSNFIDDIVLFNAKKRLQKSIDTLIDNNNTGKNENNLSINNKNLKSLSSFLEGKYGRFRQNLLGKRVDFSARSVIIVNPLLKIDQCGLPYEIVSDFLKFPLLNYLFVDNNYINLDSFSSIIINDYIQQKEGFLWILLSFILKKYSIILNRAPTLHKLGLQSFDPFLTLDQAIHLHPLLCNAFNADFDGDQMGVYLPLYETSQIELKKLMKPSYNIFSSANGNLIIRPTQDIIIGCYYLTLMIKKKINTNLLIFNNCHDVIKSFILKKISIHTPLLVKTNSLFINIVNNNNKFYFININSNNILKIKIFKILYNTRNNKMYYFLTNIGIFTSIKLNNKTYKIIKFFLESTPGRIFFNLNYYNLIKNYVCK